MGEEKKVTSTIELEIVTNLEKVQADLDVLWQKVTEVVKAVNAIGEADRVTEARQRALQSASTCGMRNDERPEQVVARAAAYADFLLSGAASPEAPAPQAG